MTHSCQTIEAIAYSSRSKKGGASSGRDSLPPITSSSTTPMAPQLQPLQTNMLDASLRRSNTLAPFTTLAQKVRHEYILNLQLV